MAFKFKQFSIEDSECAMKVGTDAVLLGAWVNLKTSKNVLDIGTGSGIIALMAAQESNASIVALEIEINAHRQSEENTKNSPWSDRITCVHSSLQEYFINHEGELFDHIITNPPYFTNSLKSPVDGRNKARHNDDLPFDILVESVNSLMTGDGKFSIILPYDATASFVKLCNDSGLNVSRQLTVKPRSDKEPNRVLLEITRGELNQPLITELSIRDEKGNYTTEYKTLTAGFYLNF